MERVDALVSCTHESIRAMTADDIHHFHQQWYRPANLVFAAAGNIVHDQLVDGEAGEVDLPAPAAVDDGDVDGQRDAVPVLGQQRLGAQGPHEAGVHRFAFVIHPLDIRFVHRPLSRYVNALADPGLVVERMLEPAPPAGFLDRAPEYREAATIPRLLVLVTRRRRD